MALWFELQLHNTQGKMKEAILSSFHRLYVITTAQNSRSCEDGTDTKEVQENSRRMATGTTAVSGFDHIGSYLSLQTEIFIRLFFLF